MRIAYIYHVIGTLKWRHIRYSLESLAQQDVSWASFVLYNAGDFPDEEILALVPDKFEEVVVFPYRVGTPKSASADWEVQMREIGGHDRYFVHKADFYLPNGVCRAYQESKDPFVLFSKFDMKERARIETFRRFARLGWKECLAQPKTGSYGDHLGKLAIPFRQGRDGIDGTMHAYDDCVRAKYHLSEGERKQTWGGARSIQRLAGRVAQSKDDRFFALHMFHETPHREDATKKVPGERF